MAPAKPIMSEDLLKKILQAFAVVGYEPEGDMVKSLAKATGKNVDYIKITYGDVYKQVEADGSPFGPMPQIIPEY